MYPGLRIQELASNISPHLNTNTPTVWKRCCPHTFDNIIHRQTKLRVDWGCTVSVVFACLRAGEWVGVWRWSWLIRFYKCLTSSAFHSQCPEQGEQRKGLEGGGGSGRKGRKEIGDRTRRRREEAGWGRRRGGEEETCQTRSLLVESSRSVLVVGVQEHL